jgi:GT2 family glycosyltransferase
MRIVVCDNGSENDSIERIAGWVEGRIDCSLSADPRGNSFGAPRVRKPAQLTRYTREEAERGGDLENDDAIVLVENGANLGFAGGTNVGLRYALARGDCAYAWLLNNDTIVEPFALTALVNRMESDPAIGLCGSTLVYHHDPNTVQALGGATYNSWFGIPRNVSCPSASIRNCDPRVIERKLDYIVGASMLASRRFLDRVGLLEERYFLYFEEIDWARRGQADFAIGYAPESVVYHKEGASAGSGVGATRSELADYMLVRSRILFTRRFHPLRLPTVLLGVALAMLNRACRGQMRRVPVLLRAAFGLSIPSAAQLMPKKVG